MLPKIFISFVLFLVVLLFMLTLFLSVEKSQKKITYEQTRLSKIQTKEDINTTKKIVPTTSGNKEIVKFSNGVAVQMVDMLHETQGNYSLDTWLIYYNDIDVLCMLTYSQTSDTAPGMQCWSENFPKGIIKTYGFLFEGG